MKKTSTRLIAAFILLPALLLIVTQVHTKPGAPPAGGLSGDPSRTSCALIGCHPGPELSFGAGQLDFNMGIVQSSLSPVAGQTYVPGQVYYMQLHPTVTNGANTRYGFQTTSLDASGNMVGAFTITDATNTSAQSLLSRNYIGHKNASSFNDWTYQWTAPATNIGKITFYYAVDAADGNGSESGDKIYKGSVDIFPAGVSGINDHTGAIALSCSVYPNPVSEQINLHINSAAGNKVTIRLFNLKGELVQQSETQLSAGDNLTSLNVSYLPAATYMLQVSSAAATTTQKILLLK